jgi:hypothetical protein
MVIVAIAAVRSLATFASELGFERVDLLLLLMGTKMNRREI